MHQTTRILSFTAALTILACASACDDGGEGDPVGARTPSELELGEFTPVLRDATPRALDPGDLRHVVELREQLGLDADPDFVLDLYADPGAFAGKMSDRDDLFGLVLTGPEVAAVQTRDRLAHHGGELEAWLRSEHAAVYAGLHIDRGGVLRVLLTGPAGPLRAEIRERLPEELRAHLSFATAEHTLAALIAREEVVSRALAELQVHGYEHNGTAADVVANRVSVFVPADRSHGVEEALRRTVGLDMIGVVVEAGRSLPTGWLKNQAYAWDLVAGGQYITDNVHACTSAVSVHGAFGPFMLTAGHCFPGEKTVYQGGDVLGVVKARSVSGKTDAEAISTYGQRNTAGRFHRNADDAWSPVHWAIGLEADTLGSIVCTAGATTTGLDGYKNPGVRCGALTQRYFRPAYADFPSFSANFRVAQFTSNFGDSGALVYWDTIYGTGAVGIVSGKSGAGHGIYSHLPYVLEQWGVTLDAPG